MPIQAFMDESGVKGQGRFLTIAGFIGRSEDWADFADRWQAILDTPPMASAMHMHEAAHFEEEFAFWSVDQRDQKVRDLASVIADYDLTAIHCTVDMTAYKELIQSLDPARIGKLSRTLASYPRRSANHTVCVFTA